MSAEEVKRWAVYDLEEADMIQNEVTVYYDQAKAILDLAWERVTEGIAVKEGRAGCLQGSIEDYVQKLDASIAKKDVAFAKNRLALLQKVESEASELESLANTAQQ